MDQPQTNQRFSWLRVLGAVLPLVLIYILFVIWRAIPPVRQRGFNTELMTLYNAHHIGIGIHLYTESSLGLLPTPRFEPLGHSWRVELCQYLCRDDLYRAYQMHEAWDSVANRPIAERWVSDFASGMAPVRRVDAHQRVYTDFGFVTGPGTANPSEGPVVLEAISSGDGLAQTILVGECSGLQIVWTEPRDPDVSKQVVGMQRVTTEKPTAETLFSSYSRQGIVVGFADGSTRQLSYRIDPKVLAALCTINGGDAVSPDELNR